MRAEIQCETYTSSFFHLAAGAAALSTMPRRARALDYPVRPVRIIAGFAPNGAGDIIARLIAQWLTDHLGQSFVVENKPGAATNISPLKWSREQLLMDIRCST